MGGRVSRDATWRGRRADALYHDNSGGIGRAWLCERVAWLESELEGARGRTARRVIVSDPETDCATGHCECGGCGGSINPYAAYCEHCGARLEDA